MSESSPFDFTDRVVAITGARGRLGRQVSRRLLSHGATVAGLDLPSTLEGDLALLSEPGAHAYPLDATDEDDVRATFEQVYDAHGRLDALVHTVGTWAGAPLLETSQADFERLMGLNLTSAFLCFREAARQMQKGRKRSGAPAKRLIGIASGQGADRGAAHQYGYSAAKAGVVRLVEAADAELREAGIAACAVAPSTILFEDGAEQDGVPVARLVDLIEYVLSPAGDALGGTTLRAYGSAG